MATGRGRSRRRQREPGEVTGDAYCPECKARTVVAPDRTIVLRHRADCSNNRRPV